MEVEDPISSKFQTLIESLMVKATSDIVKTFTDVLLETREEISRSWKKIDVLKQQLRDSEERRMQAIAISQVTCSLKKEDGGMSCLVPQVSVSDTSKTSPEDGGRKDEEQTITDEEIDPKQSCVEASEPATHQIISPGTSGTNLSINGPKQNNGGQLTQTVVTHTSRGPPKSSAVTKRQKCKKNVVSKSPLHTVSVVSPPQTSSNTTIKIFNKESKRKQAVVKKKYMYKKIGSTCNNTTTHKLRDRQLLSTHRPCLCCSSDLCFQKTQNPKTNTRVVTHVYTCKQCGKRFYEWMLFKHHECMCRCSRCGQTFTSLKKMATHRRNVATFTRPYPYSCSLCGYSSATQCGWNMHRRTHAHSGHSQNAPDSPELSQVNTVPKELNARVEVRLERISDAQLEAALCPKGTLSTQETTSLCSLNISQNLPSGVEISLGTANELSTCTDMNTPELREESTSQRMIQIGKECLPSTSTTGMDKDVKQADIQSAFAQIKQEENGTHWDSLTAQKMPSVKCEKQSSTKKGNSSLRKQKMSDCNHGIHDGVFPVEKIVRWRNTKGRNEVRVKWMPCSLCGAKWKNTWEPAESFISYKDSKNETEA